MLARLILGPKTSVRAPVSLAGRNLAAVASKLGVTDAGYVALNLETAETLGIARFDGSEPSTSAEATSK